MSGSDGSGMMNGGFWLMLLVALVLVVILGATILFALRTTSPQGIANESTVGPVAPSPREVLDLRLARGDISQEEYGTAGTLLGPRP